MGRSLSLARRGIVGCGIRLLGGVVCFGWVSSALLLAQPSPQPPVRPVRPPFPPTGILPSAAPQSPAITPPAPSNPAAKLWPFNDQDLQNDVVNRITLDSSLHHSGIQVTVLNGVVTLTGTVETGRDRQRAELDAYAASPRAVRNLLQVSSPPATQETNVSQP